MPYKYVHVGDTATFVHHTGRTTLPQAPPDCSRGSAIACLHGAGGNQGVFDRLVEALSDAHSPLALDLPGHGRSGGLDSLGSIEAMGKFAREALGVLRTDRPVLLGHGMGGDVALQVALAHSGELSALVLVSTCGRHEGLDARIEATRRVVEGKDRRAFERERFGPDATPEVMQRGFMEGLKTDPRSLLGDLVACRDWAGIGDAGSLRVPTLVVCGEHDSEALRAGAERLAADVRGAQHAVIPGAGHEVPIEQPAALAEAVRGFLAGLPR